MKVHLIAASVLWGSLVVDFARLSFIPPHCLVIPVACAVMLWLRSGMGVLLAGGALLIDWVAHPSALPLTPLLIPPLAIPLMSSRRPASQGRTRRFPRLPDSWRLPALTLVGMVLQLASIHALSAVHDPTTTLTTVRTQLADAALFAIPASVALAIVQHAAGELGLRRVEWR